MKNEFSDNLHNFLNDFWEGNFQQISPSYIDEIFNNCQEYVTSSGYPNSNFMFKRWSFDGCLTNLLHSCQLIKLYQEAIKYDAKNSRIWKLLGFQYYYQDMFKETICCLKESLYLGFDEIPDATYELLGCAYAKNHDKEKSYLWFNMSKGIDFQFILINYGSILGYAQVKFKKNNGWAEYNSSTPDLDIKVPPELLTNRADEEVLEQIKKRNQKPEYRTKILEIVEKGLIATHNGDAQKSLSYSKAAIEILKENMMYLNSFKLIEMEEFRKFETLLYQTAQFAPKNDSHNIENVLIFALLLNITDYFISPGFVNTIEQRILLVNKQPYFYTQFIKNEITPLLSKNEILDEPSNEVLPSKLYFIIEAEVIATSFLRESRYKNFNEHYLKLLNDGYFSPIATIEQYETAKDKLLHLLSDTIIKSCVSV